jgi:hypothetical protein
MTFRCAAFRNSYKGEVKTLDYRKKDVSKKPHWPSEAQAVQCANKIEFAGSKMAGRVRI